MRKLRLLVVDDEPDAVEIEREILEDQGHEVVTATSGEQARRLLEKQFFDLLLLDERMPGMWGTELLVQARERYPDIGAIFVTGHGDLDCAVRAMRSGALDLLEKPVDRDALIEAVQRALDHSKLAREGRYLRYEAQLRAPFAEIIGDSPALQRAMQMVSQVAPTDAPVLLLGESGTGKELVARAIHDQSRRQGRPFLPVNMGAIPPTLVESSLFGHKKGAFTGATGNRVGYFEAAEGGTIFLDEIGEVSTEVQVRLLRALDRKRIIRVGDAVEIPIDARVIAATNRDLFTEVKAGRFRDDLYYRLAVMPISLPPLRERKDDIVSLATHFLAKNAEELRKPVMSFAPEALAELEAYSWPGNVRELNNVIQRAVILAPGDTITPDLILVSHVGGSTGARPDLSGLVFKEAQRRFETEYFSALLARTEGNKTRAAEEADIDRTVLYEHLRKLGLLEAK